MILSGVIYRIGLDSRGSILVITKVDFADVWTIVGYAFLMGVFLYLCWCGW